MGIVIPRLVVAIGQGRVLEKGKERMRLKARGHGTIGSTRSDLKMGENS